MTVSSTIWLANSSSIVALVIVAADRAVAYEKVVAAMDVIKAAKIEKVGLATDAR